MEQLKKVEKVRKSFQIEDSVVFVNYPHTLSNITKEVIEEDSVTSSQSQVSYKSTYVQRSES